MKRTNGFTLIELMISMAVTMLLLVGVYVAVNSSQRNTAGIERKVGVQQDVKPALDLMAMEIGMASYNPNFTTGMWLAAGSCATPSTTQGYKGIQLATANAIEVQMDVVENGSLTDANEVISYSYNTTNLYMTRGVCSGGAMPNPLPAFLGDLASSGNPQTLRVINATLGIPVFRYYDGTGTEITIGTGATQLPLAIPNIRRIDICLAVETAAVDPNTKQTRKLIYSTSVIPRNHAL
ncbi:MAG: hypothetical protein CSYNP_03419 [Syntrophus sp. SKADARSKE-3]|nr:hypothetical protein [Syntrophus sp. SKADARSKE-3]